MNESTPFFVRMPNMPTRSVPVVCRDERKTYILPEDTLSYSLPPHQHGLVVLAMSSYSHVLPYGSQLALTEWAAKIRALYTSLQAQEVANALDNCCK